jgi:5-methyltetrahydrofolate--homocysteine methyltransferase
MESQLSLISESIMNGDMAKAPEHVQSVLDAGMNPSRILNDGMIPAMTEVGRLFEAGDYFVPEMLISARAMQAGLGILKPHLVATGVEPIGKVVIGTVKGDLHDIGKNLVIMMLEGAGFEIVDLGTNVQPDTFVKAVQENKPDIVAMSALLTTTMPMMKTTIEAMAASKIFGNVKIMVGGAPVTTDFANMIGAAGFAPDASQAATLAKALVS